MGREIKADYKQEFLLPRSIEEWLPINHPARFIREFVDSIDLQEVGISSSSIDFGRPKYSSELLLKVWLYGWYSGLRSSRKLEKGCLENIALIWLTGMNYPDHNTLWRFFKENRASVEKLTTRSVRVAASFGLVGLVLHALDGTKIKGRSSNDTALYKDKLENSLKRLEEKMSELFNEMEGSEGDDEGSFQLPDELSNMEEMRKKIREGLAALDASNKKNMHLCEPEANMMKIRNEGKRFGYNAQAVTDGESGLIVAHSLSSDTTDAKQLVNMLDKTKEVLGGVAEETLADAGYNSLEEMAIAENKGYEVLMPVGNKGDTSRDKGEFDISKFEYDEERDVYICPAGNELAYECTINQKLNKYPKRIYRCRSFVECPFKEQCSKDKRGRRLKVSVFQYVAKKQQEKQKEESKKQLMRLRKSIVERVFARIKEGFGFRRFSGFGLKNASAQWSLICLIYNLKIMYKFWLNGRLRLRGV